MEIANWLDTLLNVMVFAFIGAMLWFYLKKGPPRIKGEPP